MRYQITLLLLSILILIIPKQVLAQYTLVDSKNPIIEKMTSHYKNRSLSMGEVDQIVRDLSQSGLFQVVFAEKLSGNKVAIRAQQASKVEKIIIKGNASFTQDEILDKMKVKIGSNLSRLEIKQAIEKIRELYAESGFYNFNITHSRQRTKDGINLVINIEEKDYCIIEDIKFFSKSPALNKELKLLTQDFIKANYKKYSSNKLTKTIEEYLLEHRYLTAKISDIQTTFNQPKTKVKINYSIGNPTQFEFVFHGNKHFSHFDLIKESKIGGKFLYLSDSSTEIVDNIYDIYIRNGFPKVQVDFSEESFPTRHKKVLVFEISEGPRIKIGKINIVGKLSKNKSYYLRLFKEKLAEESHSVFFVEKDIKSASKKMMVSLQREGYLQAQLLSSDIAFTKDNYANISLQIDENILTYVRQVLFRGAKSYNNIELKEEVEIESNKPLKMQVIEDSFKKLENFYREAGYLEFKIKNKDASVIQYKPGQPYADIVFQIEEGPQIKVQSIVVNGLKKTKKYVVIRELDFVPGDILSLSKVTDSIDRLEKIGLFSKVNIKSLEQDTQKSLRTIVVEVEERKPGIFSAGIGIFNGGRFTQRGYVGVLYNNLGGKARGFSSRVDLQYQDEVFYPENRIAVSYYEPYLFENRVRGRVSLVREEELFSFNTENSRIISRNDVRLSGEKEFGQHLRFTYNVWDFSNQTFFNVDNDNDTSTINVATTGPIIEFDYRDDQFLPTKGNYTKIDFEFSDPILGSSRGDDDNIQFNIDPVNPDNSVIPRNEVNFIRTTLSTTFYTPLTKNKRWVWANSLRGGFLKNISSQQNSGVPATKSFLLGGSSSHRGFSSGITETLPGLRELCIRNGFYDLGDPTNRDLCNFDNIYVRGSSTYFLIKSELRFPIYGNFGGILFYDGGAVYISDFELEDPYRDAIGFGFRYDTPVGSFVIGLGYKLDRKLGDPNNNSYYDKEGEVAIYLSIGTF